MSGADLKTYIPQITELAKRDRHAARSTEIDGCRLDDGTRAVLRNVKLYKPIIAAIDGPCVAGGMEMLGGVDIRIATPNATFGVMEPKRGPVRRRRHHGPAAPPARLPGGDGVPADRRGVPGAAGARARAASTRSSSPTSCMDRALEWAGAHHANAPLAVQATKESVLRGLAGTLDEAYGIEQELSQQIFATEDAKEGPKAFAEKRPPELAGRDVSGGRRSTRARRA